MYGRKESSIVMPSQPCGGMIVGAVPVKRKSGAEHGVFQWPWLQLKECSAWLLVTLCIFVTSQAQFRHLRTKIYLAGPSRDSPNASRQAGRQPEGRRCALHTIYPPTHVDFLQRLFFLNHFMPNYRGFTSTFCNPPRLCLSFYLYL